VVGDYYFQNKEYRLAKDAYSKALSNVTSSNELSLLQAKLQKVLDAE
jgi:predicted negative regulator of RcsB-dependent stress response